jgi:hypothetical protein
VGGGDDYECECEREWRQDDKYSDARESGCRDRENGRCCNCD